MRVRPWRRASALAALTLVLLGGALTACGGEQSGGRAPDPSATTSSESSAAAPGEPSGASTDTGDHRARQAESNLVPERPTSLVLPDGTTMPVGVAATGRSGELQVPEDIRSAGWWNGGSRIGDLFGAIVIAAHVDSFTQGVGPFAQLHTIGSGEVVELVADGVRQRFEVDTNINVDQTDLATDTTAFSPYDDIRLVLITCGGPYDRDGGGYRDNVVVQATPVGEPVVVPET